jgi:hypothetical protein
MPRYDVKPPISEVENVSVGSEWSQRLRAFSASQEAVIGRVVLSSRKNTVRARAMMYVSVDKNQLMAANWQNS